MDALLDRLPRVLKNKKEKEISSVKKKKQNTKMQVGSDYANCTIQLMLSLQTGVKT